MRLVWLTPLVLLAACAGDNTDRPMSAETQAGLDKELAGLVPGETTSCLPPGFQSASSHTYGKTILYSFTKGNVYRNDTSGGCEGNGDDFLVVREPEGRACSGDIVRTVDRTSHITTGSCALGQFTHYTTPPKAGS